MKLKSFTLFLQNVYHYRQDIAHYDLLHQLEYHRVCLQEKPGMPEDQRADINSHIQSITASLTLVNHLIEIKGYPHYEKENNAFSGRFEGYEGSGYKNKYC
ncbi:MAG: hypothetical protein ACE14P_11330 [Methanotrichaceae archaeon]